MSTIYLTNNLFKNAPGQPNSYIIIATTLNINASETLSIQPGLTLTLYSDQKITNNGTITNDGTITNNTGCTINNNNILNNDGTIYNYGDISIALNGGLIYNMDKGVIENYSGANLNNYDTIKNDGVIINSSVITNNSYSTIINNHKINNNHDGKITNNARISNNSVMTNYGTICGIEDYTGPILKPNPIKPSCTPTDSLTTAEPVKKVRCFFNNTTGCMYVRYC